MIQWILLAIIVIALLFLSYRLPQVAYALLAVLLLSLGAYLYFSRDTPFQRTSQIDPSTIVIKNAIVTSDYGGSYRFNARLVNKNENLILRESTLSLTMLDCPREEISDDCIIIGQSAERVLVQIPALQARDISLNFYFNKAHALSHLYWRYKIIQSSI